MDKVTSKQMLGIDVSKDTFDVYSESNGHAQFSNDAKGFKAFAKTLSNGQHCVMESTGSYHQRLALFLFERGITVSIVNPLSIRKYIEMKLIHVKTDRRERRTILSEAKSVPQHHNKTIDVSHSTSLRAGRST